MDSDEETVISNEHHLFKESFLIPKNDFRRLLNQNQNQDQNQDKNKNPYKLEFPERDKTLAHRIIDEQLKIQQKIDKNKGRFNKIDEKKLVKNKNAQLEKAIRKLITFVPEFHKEDALYFLDSWLLKTNKFSYSINPENFKLRVFDVDIRGTNIADILRFFYNSGHRFQTEDPAMSFYETEGEAIPELVSVPKGAKELYQNLQEKYKDQSIDELFNFDPYRISEMLKVIKRPREEIDEIIRPISPPPPRDFKDEIIRAVSPPPPHNFRDDVSKSMTSYLEPNISNIHSYPIQQHNINYTPTIAARTQKDFQLIKPLTPGNSDLAQSSNSVIQNQSINPDNPVEHLTTVSNIINQTVDKDREKKNIRNQKARDRRAEQKAQRAERQSEHRSMSDTEGQEEDENVIPDELNTAVFFDDDDKDGELDNTIIDRNLTEDQHQREAQSDQTTDGLEQPDAFLTADEGENEHELIPEKTGIKKSVSRSLSRLNSDEQKSEKTRHKKTKKEVHLKGILKNRTESQTGSGCPIGLASVFAARAARKQGVSPRNISNKVLIPYLSKVLKPHIKIAKTFF